MKKLTLSLLAVTLCSAPLCAQKDADQRGIEKSTPVSAPQAPSVVCTPIQTPGKGYGSNASETAAVVQNHLNANCNPAFAFSWFGSADRYVYSSVVVCCVPK